MISSKEAAGVGETPGFFVGGGGWTVGAILCGFTGNCDYDGSLEVTPRSPDAFPAPFVTWSLRHHARPPCTYIHTPALSKVPTDGFKISNFVCTIREKWGRWHWPGANSCMTGVLCLVGVEHDNH